MESEYIFDGELFGEILTIEGKDFEHVGFRSYDGTFEHLLDTVAETKQLPKKVKVVIIIQE